MDFFHNTQNDQKQDEVQKHDITFNKVNELRKFVASIPPIPGNNPNNPPSAHSNFNSTYGSRFTNKVTVLPNGHTVITRVPVPSQHVTHSWVPVTRHTSQGTTIYWTKIPVTVPLDKPDLKTNPFENSESVFSHLRTLIEPILIEIIS